jgi:hypothetical protein
VAVSPSRVLVATAQQVLAVQARIGPTGGLSLDERFAAQGARAPIAGLLP